jgi:hypothetical protein
MRALGPEVLVLIQSPLLGQIPENRQLEAKRGKKDGKLRSREKSIETKD